MQVWTFFEPGNFIAKQPEKISDEGPKKPAYERYRIIVQQHKNCYKSMNVYPYLATGEREDLYRIYSEKWMYGYN